MQGAFHAAGKLHDPSVDELDAFLHTLFDPLCSYAKMTDAASVISALLEEVPQLSEFKWIASGGDIAPAKLGCGSLIDPVSCVIEPQALGMNTVKNAAVSNPLVRSDGDVRIITHRFPEKYKLEARQFIDNSLGVHVFSTSQGEDIPQPERSVFNHALQSGLVGCLLDFWMLTHPEAVQGLRAFWRSWEAGRPQAIRRSGRYMSQESKMTPETLVHHFKLIVGYWLLMPPMRAGLKARATGQTN